MFKMDQRVVNGSLAGGLAVIVFWVLGYFAPDLMATAPTGLEAAFTAVFSQFIAWLIPRSPDKPPS